MIINLEASPSRWHKGGWIVKPTEDSLAKYNEKLKKQLNQQLKQKISPAR